MCLARDLLHDKRRCRGGLQLQGRAPAAICRGSPAAPAGCSHSAMPSSTLVQQMPRLTARGMLPLSAEWCPLQERLKPILLRRMKEDVETLPEKEEIVVWVQLTKQQLVYYKALMSREVGMLVWTRVLARQRTGYPFLSWSRELAEAPHQGGTLLGSCLWGWLTGLGHSLSAAACATFKGLMSKKVRRQESHETHADVQAATASEPFVGSLRQGLTVLSK